MHIRFHLFCVDSLEFSHFILFSLTFFFSFFLSFVSCFTYSLNSFTFCEINMNWKSIPCGGWVLQQSLGVCLAYLNKFCCKKVWVLVNIDFEWTRTLYLEWSIGNLATNKIYVKHSHIGQNWVWKKVESNFHLTCM